MGRYFLKREENEFKLKKNREEIKVKIIIKLISNEMSMHLWFTRIFSLCLMNFFTTFPLICQFNIFTQCHATLNNCNIFMQLRINIETFSAICANFTISCRFGVLFSVGVKKQGEEILNIFETFWQQFTLENILN